MKVLVIENEASLRRTLVTKIHAVAQEAHLGLEAVMEACDLAEAGSQLQEADAVLCADSFPDPNNPFADAQPRWRLVLKGLKKLRQMDGRERHFVLLTASAGEASAASGKGIAAFIKPQGIEGAIRAVLGLGAVPRQTADRHFRMNSAPCFTLEDLSLGDHLCCLWNKDQECKALVASFISKGVERGEKILYFLHPANDESLLTHLRTEALNLEPYLAEGRFSIIKTDSFPANAKLTPHQMIELLCAETEEALAQGYAGLRVIIPPTWLLRSCWQDRELIEYEAGLNTFLSARKFLVLCTYDQQRFSPHVALDAFYCHPIVAVGERIYDNFYYVPPEAFVDGDRSASFLRNCLRNLAMFRGLQRQAWDTREQLKIILRERALERKGPT